MQKDIAAEFKKYLDETGVRHSKICSDLGWNKTILSLVINKKYHFKKLPEKLEVLKNYLILKGWIKNSKKSLKK